MKKLLTILIFSLFFTPFMAGCEAVPFISPIVTGVIMWQEGEAHKYYPYNADVVYRATKRALDEMGMAITKDEPKKSGGHYLIAGKEDPFKINVDNIKDDISLLSVRVNFMGDKDYAELFYSKVDNQLSTIRFDENGKPYFCEGE